MIAGRSVARALGLACALARGLSCAPRCAADAGPSQRAPRAHAADASAPAPVQAVEQAQGAVCLPGEARRGVGAFCIDRTLVTRAAFVRFAHATGHLTDAERQGFGIEAVEGMLDWEWRRAPGASYRRPFSREDADTRAFLRDDAPAVMVSFRDATAYCAWRGGRLPREAEWEYAMGAGAPGTRYPWGARPEGADGRPRLNYWQGASHARNERHDGYVYVSPVRAFPPNAWGLYDPVGNVWQWTSDLYTRAPRVNADGGRLGDPAGDGAERVLRGGSWWCAACTCEGYGLHYRGHAHPRAAFSNNGFRCAYDRAPTLAL